MNPKTFTLQKLFEMQLERFEEQIVEITSGASKELTIENGINQIADTWRVQRFEVIKYFKGDAGARPDPAPERGARHPADARGPDDEPLVDDVARASSRPSSSSRRSGRS